MTKPKREYIPFKERLASALSYLLTEDERSELRSRQASADDVISLFELDHNIPVRLGGSKLWWNHNWLTINQHKPKTKSDKQAIAKADRFERLEYTGTKRTEAQQRNYRPIPSRPFPSKEDRRKYAVEIAEKYGRKPWS